MVDRQLAFSVLQLVALSLPAFAILLQIVVESDVPYTHHAVGVTTAGLGMFLVAAALVMGELVFSVGSLVGELALLLLIFGILSMLVGGGLIGLQTRRAQQRHLDE